MPARITLVVDNKVQFDRIFTRIDERFNNLTPIWGDVKRAFWRYEKEQFKTEGAAGRSGAWQKLSNRYVVQKIERYGGKGFAGSGILVASGRLKKSLTGETSDLIYQTSSKEFAIGSSVPYGKYHQRGGGRLPKRELISLSDNQKRRLQKTIQKALVREMRKGSLYVESSAGGGEET